MSTNATDDAVTTSSISSSAQTTIPSSSSSEQFTSLTSSLSSEVTSNTTPESTTEASPSSAPESSSAVIETSTAESADPTTQLFTSVVIQTPTAGGESSNPTTVVETRTISNEPTSEPSIDPTSASTAGEAAASASSSAASLANNGSNNGSGGGSGGLNTGSKVAIAVVIPVVGIALILLGALFFWRKRKAKKAAEEQRRKEVEDYGFNPNNDPTLPAVGSEAGGPEMTEDHSSGYRGWGAATASNRKGSTTLSGGHTQNQPSDADSNPFTGSSPGGTNPDAPNMRDTMSSDELGALGAAPAAGTAAAAGNMRRGPSNASSRYSNGGHSEGSLPDDHMMRGNPGQAYDYGYSQAGPYGDGSYGGGADMPIVRDVSARRNTRIQQPSGTYQQGNSGIAQNF